MCESLALFERIGSGHNVARVLNALALVALWRAGSADAAATARDASRAVELFDRMGYSFAKHQALDTLGQAMAALGRIEEGSDPARRWATLLGAEIALRVDPDFGRARRWLLALLADQDLDFELRQRADALLAPSQAPAAPAFDGQPEDLMDELRLYLRRQS